MTEKEETQNSEQFIYDTKCKQAKKNSKPKLKISLSYKENITQQMT